MLEMVKRHDPLAAYGYMVEGNVHDSRLDRNSGQEL
jgi:hypothetical protein